MYAWIWNRLPGNALVRAFLSLVLFVAVVAVLFKWVFPWAEPLLPFGDVTVDNGGTNSVQPVGSPSAKPSTGTSSAKPSTSSTSSTAPSLNGAALPTYVPLVPTGVAA
ncbi:hypothetical protein [Streptacidiphilus carbonis]|uniref:hypothetical protein n=1 Tax=Streptacidiphilus carbonis TaxID=105422 RepID=UPI000693A681|nr:hypothetical protein [Streptacidiphilus carbonis]